MPRDAPAKNPRLDASTLDVRSSCCSLHLQIEDRNRSGSLTIEQGCEKWTLTEALLTAWDETLKPYFDEVLKSIPADTAILLSIYSVWELDGPLEICGSIWLDGMKEILENSLIDEALSSDRNRF
ncbi:hypothetical protein [Nitrobacter sp. TKz-YC02]|uniref:hypothetical protein n=1 Tax=Nitrobacter sp. TKz-YC02 TaxID=3398704 RepID=UPI003CE9C24F